MGISSKMTKVLGEESWKADNLMWELRGKYYEKSGDGEMEAFDTFVCVWEERKFRFSSDNEQEF